MKLFRASSFLAILSLAVTLSIAVPAARATQLSNDNVSFYGMDDSGHIVFNISGFGNCPDRCFETFINDSLTGFSSTAPEFAYDNGTPCSPSSVPIAETGITAVCNNGITAYYGEPVGTCCFDNLYEYSATSNPQLLISLSGFTGPIHMNSLGDIVIDNGSLDEWFALGGNITETPEPPSLLLLATGLSAFVLLLLRRRPSGRSSPLRQQLKSICSYAGSEYSFSSSIAFRSALSSSCVFMRTWPSS